MPALGAMLENSSPSRRGGMLPCIAVEATEMGFDESKKAGLKVGPKGEVKLMLPQAARSLRLKCPVLPAPWWG